MAKMKVQQNLPKIRFDIMKYSKLWFAISLTITVLGLFCMFTRGFNFGIDFTGGTIIDMRFERQVTLTEIRDVLKGYNLDNATIQLSGEASNVESSQDVMIRTIDLEENQRKEIMASLNDKVGAYTVLREEKVGATIGGELITDALMATVISWILIILYVSYRFEWRFGYFDADSRYSGGADCFLLYPEAGGFQLCGGSPDHRGLFHQRYHRYL